MISNRLSAKVQMICLLPAASPTFRQLLHIAWTYLKGIWNDDVAAFRVCELVKPKNGDAG